MTALKPGSKPDHVLPDENGGLSEPQALQRIERLEALLALNAELDYAPNPYEICQICSQTLCRLLPVHAGLFLLYHGVTAREIIPFGRDLSPWPQISFHATLSLASEVLHDGRTRLDHEAQLAPWEQRLQVAGHRLICVAIKDDTTAYGVLEVTLPKQALEQREIQLLEQIAQACARALRRRTERAEQQHSVELLIQREKQTSMSRLLTMMAHEINNPLQALHTTVHLLRSRVIDEEKRERYLHLAGDELNRLITVVQRMLDFHRPAEDAVRSLRLRDTLEVVLQMFERQFDQQRIQLVCEWDDQSPRVAGVGSQLRQVFSHLIQNATEAMGNGGTLTIRTRLTDHDVQPHPTIVVEIEDTGSGIPPERLATIFEPFSTQRDQHLGLGLALSAMIIERHGGSITAHSTGQGSLFRITLPTL